jgi:carbon monoxide dehydrogenase subunit G
MEFRLTHDHGEIDCRGLARPLARSRQSLTSRGIEKASKKSLQNGNRSILPNDDRCSDTSWKQEATYLVLAISRLHNCSGHATSEWSSWVSQRGTGPIQEGESVNEFKIVAKIKRPPEDVFAALVNFDHISDWNNGVQEVRWNRDEPLGVGTTVVYVGRFLGRNFESSAGITEYVPGQRYSSKSISGPIMMEVENTMESVDGGTKLTSVFRGESRGFFKLGESAIVRLSKKLFESATDNMKALLEDGDL